MGDILLSIDKFAESVGVDVSTALSWIEQGVCPAPVLVGGFARFPSSVVEQWAAGGCCKGKAPTPCQFERIRLAYMEDAMLAAAKQIGELSARIPEHRLDEIFNQVLSETE